MIIKGKYGEAVCYTEDIETEAVEQIKRMLDYEFTKGSRIKTCCNYGLSCII